MKPRSLGIGAAIALALLIAFLNIIHSRSATAATPGEPVIAAAGDIACDETAGASQTAGDKDDYSADGCQQGSTAKLLRAKTYAAILPLGDEQYPDGTLAEFESSYAKTWGLAASPVDPVPGNHEYHTPMGAGYYGYYHAAAGDPAKGYYSWDTAGWHFVAINANCSAIGGCNAGSPEEQWLKADLASHPAACTLAYWHQPRFSSAHHHSDAMYQPFWVDLFAAGADVVLNGHDHDYERFGPQTPIGAPDGAKGIREFVVGTGGKSHYQFTAVEPNSEVRNNTTFGLIELTLHPHGYNWQFVPAPGTGSFTDTGTGTCHGRV